MESHPSKPSSEEYISLTTSLSSRTNSLSSFALPETGKSKSEKPLQVLKVLLDTLYSNGIPGPSLVRLEKEFNLLAGEGGEGKIYGASTDFQQKLASISLKSEKRRLVESAKVWQNCVIKRLRSDRSRDLAFQVNSAHTEIRLLSKRSLRGHPNVVKLLGWALCLDSLETTSSSIPRLPLLILEKAEFDLRSFLVSPDYDHTSYADLCAICLGIGQGLQALHTEDVAHGDVKPANILIFDQYASNPNKQAVTCRWLPKLCDFGLTVMFKRDGNNSSLQRYQGTVGWRPPECYLESPLVSLQLCDVFAYGLVTWCVFIGNPSSPIPTKMSHDEESAVVKDHLGEQRNYQKASRSICTTYGMLRSDTYLTLAELTDRVVNLPPVMDKSRSLQGRRRKAFLQDPLYVREGQMSRVLRLLHDSLNDYPKQRHQRPWEYMDFNKHKLNPPVQNPVKYSTKVDIGIKREIIDSWNAFSSQNVYKLLLLLQRRQHDACQAMRQITRISRALVLAWLPWLIPGNLRQQAYDEMLYEFELSIKSKLVQHGDRAHLITFSFAPNDIGYFAHERNDRCLNLDGLYNQMYRAMREQASRTGVAFRGFRRLSDSENDAISLRVRMDADIENEYNRLLYSFARLRSRVKICCWQEHCREDPLYSNHTPAIWEEISILVTFSRFDFDTAAWICRGEIAARLLNELEREPERLWSWLSTKYLGAADITARITLFLERGCNIGQELCRDNSPRSVFQIYLESMPSGELPITVCRHFRRIATRDGATPWDLFYLTGQSPDWSDDEPMNENDLVNTALHDAVRAHNYSVVEYLVRTNFTASARNGNGQTALALAEELGRDLAKAGKKKHHIQNNQIIALLRQTGSAFDRTLGHSLQSSSKKLPIGWEPTELDATLIVYRETSIDSEADSLTFLEPSQGLLENKLALGQRRVTGQGQAYYLDPLRFLHTKLKGSEQVRSATEPTYGFEWYQKKAREDTFRPRDIVTWTINLASYLASNIYVVASMLLFALILYDSDIVRTYL